MSASDAPAFPRLAHEQSPDSAPRPFGRRRFLGVASAGAAAAVAPGAAGWRLAHEHLGWWRRRLDNYAAAYTYAWLPPAERILRHFDYLRLERADVERFVRDFERQHGRVTVLAVEANRLLYTKFLASTDFFRGGADERKPVRYVAYHDPYRSPCYSPFPPA